MNVGRTLDSEFSSRAPPTDVTLGMSLMAIYVLHVLMILVSASPFWTMCCFLVPVGPMLFYVLAGAGAAVCFVFGRREQRWARRRDVIAVLLLLFAIDTYTGGDFRWFELSMRCQMLGELHVDQLQTWAQKTMTDPQRLSALDNGYFDPSLLPPSLRSFPTGYFPTYRRSGLGGPFLEVGMGGWDMESGVIVGPANMQTPGPVVAGSPGWHWVKKIKPGVYIYAFDV